MNRFIAFCTTPIYYRPTEWRYYRLPAQLLVIDIILVALVLFIYSVTGILDSLPEPEAVGVEIVSTSFIVVLVLIASIEELLFRILPLSIALYCQLKPGALVFVAVLSSILFGYVHGGVPFILIQGLGGFIYSILFIKYAHNGERVFEASLLVIVSHTLFNGFIGLVLLLSGETLF
jgi:membrane protease YdiL (CAAX protease family)